MTRRHWLGLSALSLAGCSIPQGELRKLQAGPFSATVPASWAGSAIIEDVPLMPLYSAEDWKAYRENPMLILKPSYNNRPHHWALRFPAVSRSIKSFDRKEAGDDPTAPQVLIHKADEWSVAFTDGKHQEKKTVDALAGLRHRLQALPSKDISDVSPAFLDAHLDFMCLKKELTFDGGRGIRLVGQWNIEPQLVRRGELHYLFLGLSDDNTCQIIATFPLDVPGLPPQNGEATHLGHSTKNYQELASKFESYEADAKHWLESNADNFKPSLATLDAVMSSLVVRHWS